MTTVDVMTSRLAAGDSKEDAASFAYKTLALPMLTGSFVTAAGFIPIGFARSSAGEYTFSIFAVVSYALIVSWIVAVLFAPLLGVVILAKPNATTSDKPSAILARFRGFLVGAMRLRWLTIGDYARLLCGGHPWVALHPAAVLSAVGPPGPSCRPPAAAERFDLRQRKCRRAARRLLKGDPDVGHWSTYVGRGAIRFYLPLNVELPNDFFTQAVVVAKDVAARERLQRKLEKELADEFPSAVTRVSPLGLGPPVGWPVQYRVSGPDRSTRSATLRCGSPASSPALPAPRTSISTGWSRPGWFASRSTRIRPGCWG